MKSVKLSTLRNQTFVQGLDVVLVEPRLPIAVKQKLYDNLVMMEKATKDDEAVLLHALEMKVLLPFVSTAVLLAIRPILKGV